MTMTGGIQVTIKGLALDPVSNMPIVILKDMAGNRAIPIWIGLFEANAIAIEMEKVVTPRPLTHDLALAIIRMMGGSIMRIEVHDLRDNTFFASIILERDGEEIAVDSRPSDAIALAIRCGAPIFVAESVMDKSQIIEDANLADTESVQKWLENLKPEDFGKYPV